MAEQVVLSKQHKFLAARAHLLLAYDLLEDELKDDGVGLLDDLAEVEAFTAGLIDARLRDLLDHYIHAFSLPDEEIVTGNFWALEGDVFQEEAAA
jgi:hypothetical protein